MKPKLPTYLLRKIIHRVRLRLWHLRHKSRKPHWVLQPCGRSAQILIRSDSLIGEVIFTRCFEWDEYGFIDSYLKKGMIAFDIGANIGYYTLNMAEKVGLAGAVHAFEPCPETFAHLELNLALNNFPQVVAQCLALSQTTGEAQLHVFQPGLEVYNSLGAQEFQGKRAQGSINVKTITLDDYCHQKNISHLDFLKIDVEGAESLILKGSKRILVENPQMALLIELYEPSARQCGSSVAEGLSLLMAAGFYPHRIHTQGKLVPLTLKDLEITRSGNNPICNFVFVNPERLARKA